MSELIEQLTGLEERLAREQIDLLLAMAKQPGERPLAAEDLSRVSKCTFGARGREGRDRRSAYPRRCFVLVASRYPSHDVTWQRGAAVQRLMHFGWWVREGSSELGRTAMKVADVMTRGRDLDRAH